MAAINLAKIEYNMLIELSRFRASEEGMSQLFKATDPSRIDWDLLVNLAFEHGLATIVYHNLKNNLSDSVPPALMSTLKQHYLLNARSNLGLLNEMFNVLDMLKSNNIQAIPFKGLITSQAVYGDLATRKCGDIDILVKPGDFLKAKQLFLDEGFNQTLDELAEIDYLQSGLFHEQRRLSIDLHYGMPPKDLYIKVNRFFDCTESIDIGGRKIQTLSGTDMLLIMCINATKEYWEQRLYAYCDINEFIRSNDSLDFDQVLVRAEHLNCKRIVYTALLTTQQLYGTMLPQNLFSEEHVPEPVRRVKSELLSQLFPVDTAHKGKRGQLLVLGTEQQFFLDLMDSPVIRAIFKAPRFLKPNQKDYMLMYLPNQLYFVYFLIKPFRAMISMIGAVFRR